MSNKSKMPLVDKSRMPLAIGVAFVAFTTQFGGGFASGAQIYQYFINYGIWTLILPILAQGLLAFFFWYGLRYAYRNKTYDYRTFSDKFYGKTSIVFSNLYEITYLILIATATSAAFATGGATISTLLGIPYWICTLLVGAFILVIALYGTNVVRKTASTLSVLIIIALVAVLVPNIVAQWDAIMATAGRFAAGEVPVGSTETGAFGPALVKTLRYFLFQLPSIGLMYQHTEPLTDEKQVNRSVLYIFLVNTFAMLLTVVGLMAIAFVPQLAEAEIPMLVLVQTGVGSSILTPVISILIVLGAVSTGVNMIAGLVTRAVNAMERKMPEEKRAAGHMKRSFVISLACTVAVFFISQVGLIKIVVKGYGYLGIAGLISIAIPFLGHMIYTKFKK